MKPGQSFCENGRRAVVTKVYPSGTIEFEYVPDEVCAFKLAMLVVGVIAIAACVLLSGCSANDIPEPCKASSRLYWEAKSKSVEEAEAKVLYHQCLHREALKGVTGTEGGAR